MLDIRGVFFFLASRQRVDCLPLLGIISESGNNLSAMDSCAEGEVSQPTWCVNTIAGGSTKHVASVTVAEGMLLLFRKQRVLLRFNIGWLQWDWTRLNKINM